jgi:N-methylhydantoinase A/oxoprolinase/acetone carboxylase beta subunit
MKLKVVACGVFEPELTELAAGAPGEVHLHFLDAGLHSTPHLLRDQVQAEIDAAVGQGFSAIVVAYGLCGRGTSSIVARDCPVVLPRVHDCMTLFLGSREEYRKQFSRHPGTFYTTPGWYEKKTSLGARPGEGKRADAESARQDHRFAELARKFGERNAADIIHFFDSWKRNYTRAAFIDTGVGDRERYARHAQDMAAQFGWTYERLRGDTTMLSALLNGKWEDDRICVLQPGQRSTLTGDDRIFAAIDIAEPAAPEPTPAQPAQAAPPAPSATVPQRVRATAAPSAPAQTNMPAGASLGLGIDAGGTYTDCVLYDLAANRLLSKSKALTTHHDLMLGIEAALDRLDIAEPDRIQLVALSSTLATNSIVEGKGGHPGALIMSATPGSNAGITWATQRVVRGQMAIDGTELEAPDPDEIRAAVRELIAAGADAFAISGYASVKNPAHEVLVRQIVAQECALPVVCGHELSSRLNYVSRANTAILNARLLPVVRHLLDAVQSCLDRRRIHSTLMVVKGDGSLVNRKTALERPVETVLSGPAASVSGARHLTGLRDAVVLDMGGTTTDTAVVEDGLVRISPEGALVGGWHTSVEAADIATCGLGGDSYLSFTADRKLLVGPRRVIPLAYLCSEHPAAREQLMALDSESILERGTPEVLDFFVLNRRDWDGPMDDRERRLVEALADGPLSRGELARRVGALAGHLVRPKRLESLGIVMRSALTPTDLLHVTGEFEAWDARAAEYALGVFSDLFGMPPEQMIDAVFHRVIERLASQVLARECPDISDEPDEWPAVLHTLFRPRPGQKLHASLRYDRPIVAIGAPVKPFFPTVGQLLGAEVVIPEHAEVANAIGAIASEVVVREHATVRPGEIANYVVHSRSGRTEHENLREAVEAAKHQAGTLAQERARQSGTSAEDVRYRVNERRAYSSAGDEVLIEVQIEATVSGRPVLEPQS